MNLAFLNIGTQEMVLIVLVALFLFGGKKLPELARGLGRGIREFKDASDGIKREISDQINNFERDLDVEADIDSAQPTKNQKTADLREQMAQNNQKIGEAKTAESKFPKFGPPAGTYEHTTTGGESDVPTPEEPLTPQQDVSPYTAAPNQDDVQPFVQPKEEDSDSRNT